MIDNDVQQVIDLMDQVINSKRSSIKDKRKS